MLTPHKSTLNIPDISSKTFLQDVIHPSYEKPVVVQFWAPWCGPCKQLTPLFDKLALQFQGRMLFVKINMDKEPFLAQQLGVRSVPTLLVFSEGQPIDGVAGALPESQLKAFLDKFAPPLETSPFEEVIVQAQKAYDENELSLAFSLLQQALLHDPHHKKACLLMMRVLMHQGYIEEGLPYFKAFQEDDKSSAEYQKAQRLYDLYQEALPYKTQETASLLDPSDYKKQALKALTKGRRDEAVSLLMEALKKDKDDDQGASHKLLLRCFEAWGAEDPETLKGRRQLSRLLFS